MDNPDDSNQIIYKQITQSTWTHVQEIRNEVGSKMDSQSEVLSYASQMVASELVENAMKYALMPDQGSGIGIEFKFQVNDRRILIEVTNSIASENDLANLIKNVDEIQKTNDPQRLYVQRLTELMDKAGQRGSQLGLYRIAYEGEFNLSYELADNILTVKAIRKIES